MLWAGWSKVEPHKGAGDFLLSILIQTGPGAHLHSAAVRTGALLGDEVTVCGVDCLVPRPGASDGVLWGELYLYVTELIRCIHKIAKSD